MVQGPIGGAGRGTAALFGATIFSAAFLLFLVQPILGRLILPWYGGAPMAWVVCLLFFQSALLAGYLYAHLLSRRLGRRAQAAAHTLVLAASLAFLPFAPGDAWRPLGAARMPLHLLALLLVHIGLPFALLAATSPLLQKWYGTVRSERSPYRLFAVSNAGSLLALLCYPVLVEPRLPLRAQVLGWSSAYAACVAGCLACTWLACRRGRADPARPPDPPTAAPPRAADRALWFLLAAAASALLMATTNQVSQEVAAVPFLWILPLSAYLLSFIICFDHPRWYDRRVWGGLLLLATPWASLVLVQGVEAGLGALLAAPLLALFACSMACHGEIAATRPDARYLTGFYLLIAAGGAAGGLAVALLAPAVFEGFWEYHLALAGGCVLVMIAWYRHGAWRRAVHRPALLWAPLAAFVVLLCISLAGQAHQAQAGVLEARRNFFGLLRVNRARVADGRGGIQPAVKLLHSRISHGFQFQDPRLRNRPTSYYGAGTGIDIALRNHPDRSHASAARRRLRIGMIGLGTGTMVALGRPGDYFRIYEINPDVVDLARTRFTFLRDAEAAWDIVLGDARLQLERELRQGNPQQFDVLALDAFIGDAIPVHLLTEEFVAVCRQHLAPGGLLAFHISNRYINLEPVMTGLADRFGLQAVFLVNRANPAQGVSGSRWAVLYPGQAFGRRAEVLRGAAPPRQADRLPVVWTDDFASVWDAIIWRESRAGAPAAEEGAP